MSELIDSYVRGELSKEASKFVYDMIKSNDQWRRYYMEQLFRAENDDQDSSSSN